MLLPYSTRGPNPGDLGRGLDLGVDRGLGGGAGSCRSRCGFVSPEAGIGGAYVSDASDEHWGSFLTQVPLEELDRDVSVEDMTHEPLGFLSGSFKGSQQR